jgi:Ca2+-dependent lipid-binding protein
MFTWCAGGGKSDPYLKLQIGKFKINDRKNHIDDVVDPEFYRRFDLVTTLPGASRLKISAMDYDKFSSDDKIGDTTIDLEDRWFNDQWHARFAENDSEETTQLLEEDDGVTSAAALVACEIDW